MSASCLDRAEVDFFFIIAEPYSEYKIWIKAYTAKNEGKGSEPLAVRTDIRPPGEPIVVNLTCQNANTMFLKWLRPKKFYRTVDVYHVLYKQEDKQKWERQVVETVNNTVNHMVSQPEGCLFTLQGQVHLSLLQFPTFKRQMDCTCGPDSATTLKSPSFL